MDESPSECFRFSFLSAANLISRSGSSGSFTRPTHAIHAINIKTGRILESLHTVFAWAYIYRLTVTFYGIPAALSADVWTLSASSLFDGVIGAIVQVGISVHWRSSLGSQPTDVLRVPRPNVLKLVGNYLSNLGCVLVSAGVHPQHHHPFSKIFYRRVRCSIRMARGGCLGH